MQSRECSVRGDGDKKKRSPLLAEPHFGTSAASSIGCMKAPTSRSPERRLFSVVADVEAGWFSRRHAQTTLPATLPWQQQGRGRARADSLRSLAPFVAAQFPPQKPSTRIPAVAVDTASANVNRVLTRVRRPAITYLGRMPSLFAEARGVSTDVLATSYGACGCFACGLASRSTPTVWRMRANVVAYSPKAL